MIEDVLFLGLGFCIATVISLACVPILWARALRLTRERLEALVPLSAQEIDAERDGLRAKAAVIERRLEQDLERSRQAGAALSVELGHRTVSLVVAETSSAELRAERSALIAEVTELRRDLRDSEGQRAALEKALHDADCGIESAALVAREQAARYNQVLSLSEQRRGSIAALETRLEGLVAKLEDRDDKIAVLMLNLTQVTATRAAVAKAHEADLARLADLREELARTEAALVVASRRAIERDRRLRRRARSLASAKSKIAEQSMTIEHAEQALAALQKRFDLLEAELTQREGASAEDANLRDAVVAAGDDALKLLTPPSEVATTESGSVVNSELAGEQRP
ncbi:hypothetical protein [Lichenifustis flavocetrariae]|uniref:Uncharacterized protein n=1 Tax=Lichenifustis flavocetrariae TaxID=2949735 RepID=A0AA41YQN0_9HYPH|nr:hypothetical protein [Lichenifustis flavocetrariae]MCW6506764.1 hypothetical protein [Lichenifustis flavocetrariae]